MGWRQQLFAKKWAIFWQDKGICAPRKNDTVNSGYLMLLKKKSTYNKRVDTDGEATGGKGLRMQAASVKPMRTFP